MKTGLIIAPERPKLLKELEPWNGIVEDGRLELDNNHVKITDSKGTFGLPETAFGLINRLQIDVSRLNGLNFSGLQLDKCELTDTELRRVDCTGLRVGEASLLRVVMTDARMTGADFGGSHVIDCTFSNLKLDEAGFRFASFKRVRFEQCILRKADFGNARLHHVTFSDCDFDGINFDNAVCVNVDIRTQTLTTVKGVQGLKGTTITNEQLIQLAPLLAAELNFRINDK